MWYIFQCFFRYRSNVKNLVLTVPNMCCYGNKQCLTSKKIPVWLWSFHLTNRIEWNVQKSGRIDKTDDSKVEIQNKECKYTPDCEGMWEICEKIPPVRKQRTTTKKKKKPSPWDLLEKMEEMVENTDGHMLCALKVSTDGYCKKTSIAVNEVLFGQDISTLILAILVLFVLSISMIK